MSLIKHMLTTVSMVNIGINKAFALYFLSYFFSFFKLFKKKLKNQIFSQPLE